jgi:hypothetical protein
MNPPTSVPLRRTYPTTKKPRDPATKSIVFFAIRFVAFFARQKPVSTHREPACMNITRNPQTSTQT